MINIYIIQDISDVKYYDALTIKVNELIELRNELRKYCNYKDADLIRHRLEKIGIFTEDKGNNNYKVKYKLIKDIKITNRAMSEFIISMLKAMKFTYNYNQNKLNENEKQKALIKQANKTKIPHKLIELEAIKQQNQYIENIFNVLDLDVTYKHNDYECIYIQNLTENTINKSNINKDVGLYTFDD